MNIEQVHEQVHEHWTATYIVQLLNKTSNNIGRHRFRGYDRGIVFGKNTDDEKQHKEFLNQKSSKNNWVLR